MYDSFHPGQIWLDQEGKRIQAHGGSVFYLDGVYYWYGENKEKTTGDNNIWHWGVRCYASTDLYNWEDKGIIIPPVPDDLRSSLHPSSQMDRPHIIYNKETQKFVCWLKIMHKDGSQTVTVLTAEHILGPYEKVRENLRPLNMNAGDFDLVVADDGKAYYYFERVHSETICADLTADYTDVTGYYSTHFPHPYPPYVREATAHFYRNGKHYLATSGTTGYLPNPSEIAVADTWHGPYRVLGDLHQSVIFCGQFIHAILFCSLLLRLLSFDFSLRIFLAQAGQYLDAPEPGTYSTPHTVQFLAGIAAHRFVGMICNSSTKPMNL